MVRHGGRLWEKHPGVRSGKDLTIGERAADLLKRGFGTWAALGSVGFAIAAWILLQKTGIRWDPYPFILLNLCLSCLAAVQGIILQISANRGDRISAEVALHTQQNTDRLIGMDTEMLTLQRQQMDILTALRQISTQLSDTGDTDLTSTTPKPLRAGGHQRGIPVFSASAPATYMADISEFQPDIADATYLAWSKAIAIRALFGDAHDDAAWYGGARRADLHAGGARVVLIYQYLVSGQDAAAQAQAFHDLVGAIRPGEVFVADLEEGDHALLTGWYDAMTGLYGNEIAPYLWTYTGEDFGESSGILPVDWIAEYATTEPVSPHRLWQFSDAYDVPGVGTADCSLFHGTIDELAALAFPVPEPKPPADWTFGAPQNLAATGGHTNVKLTWDPPLGAPEAPAEYLVYVYDGTVCDEATRVLSYPRTVHVTAKGNPPFEWEGGSLERGTRYTAHVVAAGPDGARVARDVFASVTFTTG